MPLWWDWICRILDILRALLSRILFAVHGVVTVWRVVAVKQEPLYWLLLMGVALLGVEIAVTLKCTRNAEWKWFSPMVFLYLSTVIPSIWFLELSLLESNLPVNSTSGNMSDLLSSIPIPEDIADLSPGDWVLGLEQTMLIVLVLGRWLMPKGDMSRDQKSQLLMAYIGLGADILDIFDTFKESEVKTNRTVVIVGLALFTWALMQFPLVLTQTQGPPRAQPRRPRALCQGRSPGVSVGGSNGAPSSPAPCCSDEAWGLLLTVVLQDGPFLVYRLYLMLNQGVLNQLMIFFTCKNILVVLLEIYRIAVVQCEQGKGSGEQGEEEEEEEEEDGETGSRECGREQSCQVEVESESVREIESEGESQEGEIRVVARCGEP